MKAIIFLAIVLFAIGFTGHLRAQSISDTGKNQESDYFNISLSGGISRIVSTHRFEKPGQIGFTGSIDVSNTPKNSAGFFLNYSYSSFKEDRTQYYFDYRFNYSQFTFGPRFYSNQKNSFIDAGFGYYNLDGDEYGGVNMGLGGKIRLSDLYALNFGGRINMVNISNNPNFFFSVNTGIEINSKSVSSPGEEKSIMNKKFSLLAFAGTYLERGLHVNSNSFGAELSYDISKKVSILLNYLYGSLENVSTRQNETFYYYYRKNSTKNNYSSGARLYITGDNLRLFLEGLTGVFLTDENVASSYFGLPDSYHYSANQHKDTFYGFTFGGGAELLLVGGLSGIFKFDVTNYITGNSNTGLFGGFKYRL